ncbi:DNA helicase UvrD [Clostridium carboxidivorans P7]|uniref:DNA 3'-5' helicase n=1 Tax=Clostridium carboxidivorans P7 TaxID=536227 RepID=C6PW57_9CLOT|nr:UvrD-helicase domain-containing protein [Clostridium carboxidivorans]AKN30070.1 DNA helicase UvrD [Clostridium carboxidivorans P7]EET86536.1 UvrD/REP helicase [Clostridium carboxidivorans P7]EFG89078.1 UvrD/REP helicase [Clostridium carboxidivorans P7]
MSSIFGLSEEQEKAVDITKNIAVSAGAGSGKTRVLTNRYLRLLEGGLQIEEIAAITFTEKAALEMKERIRKAINEKISSSDFDHKKQWMKHLDKLNRANISTIHGFCSNIVRENAAFLGVDFSFSIIDGIDKAMFLREASQNAAEHCIELEEYEEAVEKLKSVFGEEYLQGTFTEEALRIRSCVLEEGKSIKQLCESSEEGSIRKFCLAVALKIEEAYLNYKLKKDLLDYDDLETMTLKVLSIKNLRERYRNRYKTLLVDEFQDTNGIQKNILYKIAADDNGRLINKKIFIVGDFKQSIYGFRGTDYTIFKQVSKDIENEVSLSTCYRSKSEIIKGINSIFNELIDGYQPLKCPKDEEIKEKRIKLLTYEKIRRTSDNVYTEVKNMLQGKESKKFENIQQALKALKDSNKDITVKKNKEGMAVIKAIKILRDKNLEFKDICILVRSRSVIPDIEEELKRRNVPYCIIGGVGFYQKAEVDEILNLYKVIVRGFSGEFTYEENKNFIQVLRGSLFEISDDTLLKMNIEKEESSLENLYEALKVYEDGMHSEKLLNTVTILEKLAGLKEKLSVVQIIQAIIKECNVFEIMLCQDNGLQKFRNIEKLLQEAEKFDREQLFTLEQFVNYINLLDEENGDDSEAALDTEDSEAVKIMTIHQSKGLEFKGVIIPKIHSDLLSMSKKDKPNLVYNKNSIILSKDLENVELTTPEYEEYLNSKLEKEIEETERLLYVAMTRAEDYVILTGGDDGKDPTPIKDETDKIKELNSFLKQLKYSFTVGNADKELIEFINSDDIEDLEVIKRKISKVQIDKEKLQESLNYKGNIKNYASVSATRYMKYLKCPRRFYLESVLNINGKDYIEKENKHDIAEFLAEDTAKMEVEDIEQKTEYKLSQSISASTIGTAVHSIIENLNNEVSIDEKDIIKAAAEKYELNYVDGIENKLKHYVEGYKLLEKEKSSYGSLVSKFNELDYSLSQMEHRKTSISGFIDRLEIFQKDGKYTAVITDYKTNFIYGNRKIKELTAAYELQMLLYGKAVKELLYVKGFKVEEIILELYFLDVPERVQIVYDEAKVNQYIENMDCIFVRNLSTCKASDFPKEKNSECDKCWYSGVCNNSVM